LRPQVEAELAEALAAAAEAAAERKRAAEKQQLNEVAAAGTPAKAAGGQGQGGGGPPMTPAHMSELKAAFTQLRAEAAKVVALEREGAAKEAKVGLLEAALAEQADQADAAADTCEWLALQLGETEDELAKLRPKQLDREQARPGTRARSHRRVVLPPTHFIPYLRTYSAPLFPERQCDRILVI
jgi:hypothetical protein